MILISEYMKLEHVRLLNLWKNFSLANNKEDSKKLFKKFSDAVLEHMKLEEESLSPTFNKHLNIEKEVSQTTVLSYDHVKITKLLLTIEKTLDSDDPQKIAYIKNHFIRAMIKHHKKEEELYYDLLDTIITKKDWEKILQSRVQK